MRSVTDPSSVSRSARVLRFTFAFALPTALVWGVPFDCSLTSIGVTPLNDMGPAPYLAGHVGGLWSAGSSTRPPAHEAAGLAIVSNYVLPRSPEGEVDLANGKIGLISIGMSNTSQEFDGGTQTFVARMNADPAKSGRVVIVNGAQGGQAADSWADAGGAPWTVLQDRIVANGLTAEQVQVAWIKQAEKQPGVQIGPFPTHAEVLRDDLRAIVRNLREKYPNARVAYLSSRTRAYTDAPNGLNPEPFAFESGFAVRWLLEEQLEGNPALDFDPLTGAAPWLSWGPYLWTDGVHPRSDGFQWFCSDLAGDFTHPSLDGARKVTDQLIAFFKSDPTTVPWLLRATTIGQAPLVNASADVTSGDAPLLVHFQAGASDSDGTVVQTAWTFDEGGFSLAADPIKSFPVPGVYDVHLTASDDDGNTTEATITITVGASGDPTTPYCFCDGAAPCGNQDGDAGCAGSTGEGARISGAGSASVSADDLFLTVEPVPTNQFGLVYMGGGQAEQLFGDGLRCVSTGGIGVFRYPVQSTGAAGSFTRGPIVGDSRAHFPPPGRIQSGQTWYFQGWFRDPLGPCGSAFNLSHGAAVTFVP